MTEVLMSAAKRDNGSTVTNGSPNRRSCCLSARLGRARSLLGLRGFRRSRSAAEPWREEALHDLRREPSLDELFRDSAMQLLMRRDGVTEGEVRTLLGEVKEARTAVSGWARRWSTEASDARPFPIRFI
jgi:hypothetical protein